eukprot:scaffold80518_cov57-Phaeocystis_antarctica.AAC.3
MSCERETFWRHGDGEESGRDARPSAAGAARATCRESRAPSPVPRVSRVRVCVVGGPLKKGFNKDVEVRARSSPLRALNIKD